MNAFLLKLSQIRKAIVPIVATVVGIVSLHYGASAVQTTTLVGIVEALGVYAVPNAPAPSSSVPAGTVPPGGPNGRG